MSDRQDIAPYDTDLVYTFAFAPSSVNGIPELWFTGKSSGLFRSTDGGASWDNALRSLIGDTPLPITTVILSPAFDTDRMVFAGAPGAVLRSTDGGLEWQADSLTQPTPLISALAISPAFSRDRTVFAGTAEDGVFCSYDAGASWAAWNFGLFDPNILSLAVSPEFTNDNTLLAGTSAGLFRSTNRGKSWREIPLPVEGESVLCLAFSPMYSQDGVIYLGTETSGLFKSSDHGNNWVRIAAQALEGPINSILLQAPTTGKLAIAIPIANQVLISLDHGETWESWLEGKIPTDFEITAIAIPQGIGMEKLVVLGGIGGRILSIS